MTKIFPELKFKKLRDKIGNSKNPNMMWGRK